jgi:hypothetical protein
MDPAVESLLAAEVMSGTRESARLTSAADRNLTQGLGVIQNTLIQATGSPTDDAVIMALARTAIHVPEKA